MLRRSTPAALSIAIAVAIALPLDAGAQARPPAPPAHPAPGRPAPFPRGPEPLAWYPLDGDARDAAGGASGVVVGAFRPAEDRRGDPRGAVSLGGKDHADLGDQVEPEQLTLSVWVRPARVDREGVIFSKLSTARGPRDRFLELRIGQGGRVTFALPGAGYGQSPQEVRSGRTLAPGRWTHLAATFDGDRAVLYVDGVRDGEARLQPFDASRGPAFIGARPDAGGKRARLGTGFEGRLDDLRLYRGALAPADVLALAQGRSPGEPAPGPADDDEDDDAFLAQVGRLLLRFDSAAMRGSERALARVESQILQELQEAERDALAERNTQVANHLRRAAAELHAVRGRTDARSLDRKRAALMALSNALWSDLVRELERSGTLRRDRGRGPGKRAPWY